MRVDGTNAKTPQEKKPSSLKEWLEVRKEHIASAIPENTLNINRFMKSALLSIMNPKTPLLAQCTPDSIYRSLVEAASYGLEIGGVLGQAYLIPYNESFPNGQGGWEKRMTCHFQMGYKGLIALARRSRTIKTIAAEPIYENDNFECQLGCGRSLKHSLNLKKERGKIIGYYCLVELENDGIQFAVMSKQDVEKHRDQFSKMYKKDDSENNWNKNFDAMALKTCCVKALKLCPISVEALEAVRNEELADSNSEIVDYEIQVDSSREIMQEQNRHEIEFQEENTLINSLQEKTPQKEKMTMTNFEVQNEMYNEDIPSDLF